MLSLQERLPVAIEEAIKNNDVTDQVKGRAVTMSDRRVISFWHRSTV